MAFLSARYNWPPGYWPAVDGSGIEVQIGSADGNCYPDGAGYYYVSFYKFYHVNARYPRRGGYYFGSGGGGGADDGGGGWSCSTEYVVIEISYDGGATWQTWWQGYATVCEEQ